jgi:putative FmdB family regulatory protein
MMPLYTFKCMKCDTKVEKFLHKFTDGDEILCEECGGPCGRVFSICSSEVMLNAKDELSQRILPDVRRISKNIQDGKDSDFSDLCGDN